MEFALAVLLVCLHAEPQPKLAVAIIAGEVNSRSISDVQVASGSDSASESSVSRFQHVDLDTLLDRTGLHTVTSHSSASIDGAYAESSMTSVALFELDVHQPGVQARSQFNLDSRLTDIRRKVESTFAGLSASKVMGSFVVNEFQFVTQEVRVTWRIEFHAWSNTPTIPNAFYTLEAKVGNTHIGAGWSRASAH